MMTITPVYEHDCDCCKFCGNAVLGIELFDLYYCPTEEVAIARFGDDGAYISCEWQQAKEYYEGHPLRHLADILTARKKIKGR